jgi:hypothetical protein
MSTEKTIQDKIMEACAEFAKLAARTLAPLALRGCYGLGVTILGSRSLRPVADGSM